MFRLGESAILGLRRAQIRPRWSYVGTKLAYVGPGLDLCWLMLAHVGRKVAYVGPGWGHVGPMLGLCWGYVGAESARTPNPLSVLDSPPLPPCAPSGPHVPPCAPICQIYIYMFVVLGEKKKEVKVIEEKIIRLRKEGSLLDGARVPRFPSYTYMYIPHIYIYIPSDFP